MEVKLQRDFSDSLKTLLEHDVSWNGHTFLVIYGSHINGHFIAIPNWGICCEAGHVADVFYNAERLSAQNLPEGAAEAIAEYLGCVEEITKDLNEQKEPYARGQDGKGASLNSPVFQTGSVSTSEDFDDLIRTSVQLERFAMGIGEQFSDGDLTINVEKYPGIYGCHEILFRYGENRGIDGYAINRKLKETAQGMLTEEEFKHWLMTSDGAEQHQRSELEQ